MILQNGATEFWRAGLFLSLLLMAGYLVQFGFWYWKRRFVRRASLPSELMRKSIEKRLQQKLGMKKKQLRALPVEELKQLIAEEARLMVMGTNRKARRANAKRGG